MAKMLDSTIRYKDVTEGYSALPKAQIKGKATL